MKQKWVRLIQTFFSGFNWRKSVSFLFFVLLALSFWMMLFFRKRSVEGVYRIPVQYTNVPEDIVFDRPLPDFIEVKLEDNGLQIFEYDVMPRDTIVIDVADAKRNEYKTIQGNQLIHLISQSLSNSSKLLSYYPAAISLASSKLQKKEVPIEFVGNVSTSGANFIVDTAKFIPATVTAYSSASKLEKISVAQTENTTFKNLKATSQMKVKLQDVEGVKFVPNEVEYYLVVHEFTEKDFEVPITCAHLPNGLNIKFFPSQVKVSFMVTLDEYRKISLEDFKIELDYNKFYQNTNGRVELELTHYPSSVKKTRLAQSSVEFLFEKK